MSTEKEKIKEMHLADKINNEFWLEKNIDNIEDLKTNWDIIIIKRDIRQNISNIIDLLEKINNTNIRLKNCFKDTKDDIWTLSFVFAKSE